MTDSMDGRVLDPTSPISKMVDLPYHEKLAARGVNFVRTYAASPQCVPSRTTMYAGRRTDRTRTWNNGQGIAVRPRDGAVDKQCAKLWSQEQCADWGKQQDVQGTLVDSLQAAHVNITIHGKVDVGAGILEDFSGANANGFHSGPSIPILTRSADIEKPTKPDPLNITDDNKGIGPFPIDWKTMADCVNRLRSSNPRDQLSGGANPWLLHCSINTPHPPFDTNITWLDAVHDDLVDVPVWPPEGEFHPADRYMSRSKAVWRNFSTDEVLKVRKSYFAMCAEADWLLGQILDALEATGHANSTYVIAVSDHGEMAMEHRQVWKNSLYEASSRVPMIVAGPGIRQGVVVQNLTSLLDVFPTLVDMAQGDMPAFSLDGYSLFDMLHADADDDAATGESGGVRAPVPRELEPHVDSVKQRVVARRESAGVSGTRPNFVLSQYHSNMGNTGSFMARQNQYKYITFGNALDTFNRSNGYVPQLFDVDADPAELHDLSSDPKYATVMTQMDKLITDAFDYQALDAEVKAQDLALYKAFIEPDKKLRQKFEGAYHGFDDDDWATVQSWAAGGGSYSESATAAAIDAECSYAGTSAADRTCTCFPGMTGLTCAMLDNQTVPVVPNNGLILDDYHVWGAQVQFYEGTYHMMASIYPRNLEFGNHWLTNAQIAYATSDKPEGPFTMQSIVLTYHNASSSHPQEYWDRSVDNPKFVRAADGTWLIFYTGDTYTGAMPPAGNPDWTAAQASQRLGLAYSTTGPAGPYTRLPDPILLPRAGKWDSRMTTNSAVLAMPDGSIKMMYKASSPAGATAKQTRVCLGVAEAATWRGPYTRVVDDPVFPCPENSFDFEDPSLWVGPDGTFHGVIKDFRGTVTHAGYSGAHAVSTDFAHWNWTSPNPLTYGTTHTWSDGKVRKQKAQERPQVLVSHEDGWPTHAYFATNTGLDGSERIWCMAVPLRPASGAAGAAGAAGDADAADGAGAADVAAGVAAAGGVEGA